MDGNLTAKAVVSGRVNAIPLIDSTLRKEGQAADAKATGDSFANCYSKFDQITGLLTTARGKITAVEGVAASNTVTVEGHATRIAANEAEIGKIQNTLEVSQGRLGTAEGEIDTLQGQMVTANDNITGLGNRMTTAEGDIGTLQNKDAELAEQIKTVNDELTAAKGTLNETSNKVNNTIQPDLTQAKNDISNMKTKLDSIDPNQITGLAGDMADVKTKLGVSAVTVTPDVADGITVKVNGCYKNGAVCTVTLEITNSTGAEIASGETLCTGLPKPGASVFAHGVNFVDDSICQFTIFANGNIAPWAKPLPIGKTFITATYVAADE